MPALPQVDVNLFVYNGAQNLRATIDSVLRQTWPNIALTIIDDGSSDGTWDIVQDYAHRHASVRLKRNRHNAGAIPNFQRAFWLGDADFVMPKSGDDLIAPDFVERIMDELLAHPDTAMCHAMGLVFSGAADIKGVYPAAHALHAIEDDPVARASHVMAHYTSSPSFWGIYRRSAVDRLGPIRYRAGWDHALLAELALYGAIRHVPAPLYWRRDGGKPVLTLARASTEQLSRGLALEGVLAEQRWRTPLITTAYGHLETFAAARVTEPVRLACMEAAVGIFRARFLAPMQAEAAALRAALPELVAGMQGKDRLSVGWIAARLTEAIGAVHAILPEQDMTMALLEITALAGEALVQTQAPQVAA